MRCDVVLLSLTVQFFCPAHLRYVVLTYSSILLSSPMRYVTKYFCRIQCDVQSMHYVALTYSSILPDNSYNFIGIFKEESQSKHRNQES
jgi:hypothetical protein